ncbi:MAG TPA: antitermination protein NusG [Sedimenticola sp.]|nr:antitermination protein NusG [Sedimenticola sp.]
MLLKILLTSLVILGAVLVLRRRAAQVQQSAAVRHSAVGKPRPAHIAAFGLVSVMLAGAIFFVCLEWIDGYQVVRIRVIDTRSGSAVSYEARRSDVDGRSFRTLDGVTVTLADVERMELGGE